MANRAEGAAVVPAAGDAEALQILFLDAALVLMLFGAVATIGATATSAEPALAFLSLFLWLLGVCFLALVPAAGRRFQNAALPATAAMAIAILKHLFTPMELA